MTERIRLTAAGKHVGPKNSSRALWRGVDLAVSAGERICVTGPSGCGKSTLLNCLGLLETLNHGTIHLNSVDLTSAKARTRLGFRRDHLGYLFQDYALIDNESVAQNVRLAAQRRSSQEIDAALDAVGLSGRGGETVFQLSGGEQQRVAMARVIARRPEIVLADEPTASLDRTNAELILNHLGQLANDGAAVVVVSHDPWVKDHCERSFDLADYMVT